MIGAGIDQFLESDMKGGGTNKRVGAGRVLAGVGNCRACRVDGKGAALAVLRRCGRVGKFLMRRWRLWTMCYVVISARPGSWTCILITS